MKSMDGNIANAPLDTQIEAHSLRFSKSVRGCPDHGEETTLSKITDVLRTSVRLAGDGKTDEAVDLLEGALNGLVSVAATGEISVLSRHAAILCEGGLKDDRRARRILRRALQHAPTDTGSLLSLSSLYLKAGRKRVARNVFDRRVETIAERNNIPLQEVIEVHSRRLAGR
jgi:hypothetical protein